MEHAALVWFGLLVVFVLVEASTVTMLSVWFVFGALAAMITSLLGGEIWLQVVIFLAVSALLLLALRPVARKYFTPRIVKTNVDSVVGEVGRVTQTIDNVDSRGRVRIGAMEWAARSTDGSKIEKDALIHVDRVEGVKLFVTPIKE